MPKGLDGPRSVFGELFFEHYGETCTTNRKLYEREQKYFYRTGYTSWDENRPKTKIGRKMGSKNSYKCTRSVPAPELRCWSEFGKRFYEHYGITKKDNANLYSKELKYCMKNGHVSWDENLFPEHPKLGTQIINKKGQNTMTIKDYADQLKTKYDSVSSSWYKLTIEQLVQIETCLNTIVKPDVAPAPVAKPVKKRTRKFNGFSQAVLQQKEEFKKDVANGYTGKYREWLKIKKATGTIYTNKL